MLWPLILPAQLTFWLMLALVVTATVVSSWRGWKRSKAFYLTLSFAILAFVPSCVGVMWVVDSVRFGDFHYDGFADVPDFRSRRYLPESATNIQMRKHANGYRARYEISDSDFHNYLDNMWSEYGQYSSVPRDGMSGEGESVTPEAFNQIFKGLEWQCPVAAIQYYSTSEPDGGGATYFFDAEAGLAFQHTGFW